MSEPSLVVEMATQWRPAISAVEGILARLRLNLDDLDRLTTERNTPRVVWGIDTLSYNRSIKIVLAPRHVSQHRQPQSLVATTTGLVDGVKTLHAAARIPDGYSPQMLNRLQEINKSAFKGGITAVTLAATNGTRRVGVIDGSTQENAAIAIRPAVAVTSSVTGVLDILNVRSVGKPRAQIFDPTTRHAVDVIGNSDKDAQKLHLSLGRRVTIGGVVARNSAGQAVRIKMTDLVQMPDLDDTITADDVFSSDPGVTGGLPVDEYMDWLRGRES